MADRYPPEHERSSEPSAPWPHRDLLDNLPLPCFELDAEGGLLWSNRAGSRLNPGRILKALVADPAQQERFRLHEAAAAADGRRLVWLEDLQARQRQAEEYRRLQKAGSLQRLSPGLGHDLKNRLTGVIGNLSLSRLALEEGRVGPELLTGLRDAERAALEIDALIQRYMLFALNDGQERQALDLGALVNDAAAVALGGSALRVQLSLAEPLRPVSGNAGQLQQAFQNLLLNAAEALPGGEVVRVEIFVELLASDDPRLMAGRRRNPELRGGEWVCVRFMDEGEGMLGRDLPHAFEAFFTTREGHQGLGLTVVESVLEAHGGFVELVSQAGAGTAVSCWLPADASGPAPRAEGPRRGIKILVMDDEEMVRDVWERMLTRLGHRCSFASEGGEAVFLYETAKSSDHPFDLVILDMLVARGMGAMETLERLRALDPAVQAVVASGYTQDPVMLRAAEYGFRAALPKPFTLGQLQALIKELQA